jgi:uncharacterized protein YndB with AHSA1/START domain
MDHVEREVELTRPAEEVWRALVDPSQLAVWLGGEVEVALRPGARGAFHSGDGVARRVLVLAVDDGRELCFRWWPERDAGAASTVTITVEPRGERASVVRVRETRMTALLATA